ncbi:CRISPR-associated helicase Cas3' [Eggerthella guodeyinii]|uniref:CRISPR-associated helicase Cas3 n=1 Tax=Eggerthella guodeyinii TaxID=2690837 RepID=A0A6N7RQH5_9ACTN|nr:CRISPR-associated helicase Cas3' [Eggerthella guodeyinii]MRX83593.1 CRISPR-associated helicase Cas3' [Eggerthella guodeyinii]
MGGETGKPEFVSHVSEDGRIEEVADHLREVAEMAEEFARPFGAGSWAYLAGMAHDIGKYSTEFQNRILHDGHKVDHSTAGAYELYVQAGLPLLSFCVAGHHGGLPDSGTLAELEGPTLLGRLRKAKDGELPDYRTYAGEIALPEAVSLSFDNMTNFDPFSLAFLTRMVFSCLVDADFLCTERFMAGSSREQLDTDSLEMLSERLEDKIRSFYPPQGDLNETRCAILDSCAEAASDAPGVFSLTVPTGGGKTYASLRFALRHALADGHGMRRVVYAIPYTSIIEQNAAVFREVVGASNVLEHHGNFDFDNAGEDGGLLRLATENWDAPVVVTTNVQLFESLFANKTSRCRKLHNVANSVIVLDEAQMLPTKQLLPCVRALAELVHRYGCTVVLCTATQPSLGEMFASYGCPVREIAPEPQALYERLRRTEYRFLGRIEDEELADRLASHEQVLCVVNSRKQARVLYDSVREATDDEDGTFHLSTLMHSVHREKILAKIRLRLDEGRTCRLISTSLIEAGVDVDFPVVYRALAGMDSMVQCAGRCNREGKRSACESAVYLFVPGTSYGVPNDTNQKRAIARSVMLGMGLAMEEGGSADGGVACDIGSLEAIASYFDQLHELRRERLDAENVLEDLTEFGQAALLEGRSIPLIPFKDAADRFHMIEDGSRSVIVPDPAIEQELHDLRAGFGSRGSMRRMARYSVGLYDNDIKALQSAGAVRLVDGNVYELVDSSLYRASTGLDASDAGGKGLFL